MEQLARETTVRSASYTLPDGRVIRVGSERFMVRMRTCKCFMHMFMAQ